MSPIVCISWKNPVSWMLCISLKMLCDGSKELTVSKEAAIVELCSLADLATVFAIVNFDQTTTSSFFFYLAFCVQATANIHRQCAAIVMYSVYRANQKPRVKELPFMAMSINRAV